VNSKPLFPNSIWFLEELKWWPRVKLKTSQAELNKLERMACLGITGAIRTATKAAMEGLLEIPPLHLQVQAVTRVGNYILRCNEQWKPIPEGFGHAYMSRDMENEPILQMGSDKMTPRHDDKTFIIRFPDRSEWNKGFQPDRKGGLIWYTDGSKTENGTGAGGVLPRNKEKT
jgi:hypothetical protein